MGHGHEDRVGGEGEGRRVGVKRGQGIITFPPPIVAWHQLNFIPVAKRNIPNKDSDQVQVKGEDRYFTRLAHRT